MINRYFQRQGKVWIRIFPDKPVTKKPAEVRMGKGKGLSTIGSQLFVLEESCSKLEVTKRNGAKRLKGALLQSSALKTRFVERVERVGLTCE